MLQPRAVFGGCAGCGGEYPPTQPIYRCPSCDGLLELAHDLEALCLRSPADWEKLFDERWRRTQWPYGSGVWGKREWVSPDTRKPGQRPARHGGTEGDERRRRASDRRGYRRSERASRPIGTLHMPAHWSGVSAPFQG